MGITALLIKLENKNVNEAAVLDFDAAVGSVSGLAFVQFWMESLSWRRKPVGIPAVFDLGMENFRATD